MAGKMDIGSTGNTATSSRLYKGSKEKLMHIEPAPEKVASGLENNDKKRLTSLIERFIKDNSGEYKRKSIWSIFSDKITLKEFNTIIDELHNSGKIAIDKEDKVGWIWNPKLAKKYRNRTGLALR